MREPLADGHGRPIGDVRISVTDRCNFRCQYCMPAEGLPWLEREALLTYEEIARLVAHPERDGRARRPPDRRRAARAPRAVAARGRAERAPDVHDLSLTTNGYLLAAQVEDLVRAGLRRVNVSLDSLAADRFFQLTRRDSLGRVMEGLAAAQAHPELRPIKVNAVALRGFTEDEVLRVRPVRARGALRGALHRVHAARRRPGVGHGQGAAERGDQGDHRDASTSWSRSAASATAPRAATRSPTAAARSASSRPCPQPFCGDCNRIRLTAEGMLRTCLFSLHETDLRAPLRDGASDDELEQIVRDAVWRKELKHHVGEPGFRQPPRSMSRIGG